MEVIMPVPGSRDDGFRVDPALLSGVAGQVGKGYDDLTTAISQYGQGSSAPGDFGSEVASAWSNFDNAWARELNAVRLALMEMTSNFHTSAAGYASAEARNAHVAAKVAS
jgi:hypothetical protein